MGSSWLLVCPSVLLWVLLSSASTGHVEQREVTFDLDQKGMEGDFLQREVDFADLFDPKEFPIEQIMESPPEKFDTLSERGGSRPRPRGFQPRSFGGPPFLDYPVQFPLSRPTPENLQAICLHGNHRPRYPVSYFPASGFGQLKRRANAVNQAESSFSTCCAGNQTWEREVTLCCATQAWELSVKSFCKEDSSVKDRLYHCCKLRGSDLFNCFNNDSPNPNYEPTEEILLPPLPSTANFTFDPKTCQREGMTPHSVRGMTRMTPSTSQEVNIIFPPGRPTADSIELLCRNQALRPRYSVKCLPRRGYELVFCQAKTINRMEKGFKKCCKKKQGLLNCAEQKWSEELNKFCSAKKCRKVDYPCCSGDESNLSCFQNLSPDPHYKMSSEALSFNKICDIYEIIEDKIPVGFPLKNIVDLCCSLPEQLKTICALQKLKEVSTSLCSLDSPAVRQCCRRIPQEIPDCLGKIVNDAITKVTTDVNVRQKPKEKKKKICPIS